MWTAHNEIGTNFLRMEYTIKKICIWDASWICMSSLRRSHANLLCIIPFLVLIYVLPTWALRFLYKTCFVLIQLILHCSTVVRIAERFPSYQTVFFSSRVTSWNHNILFFKVFYSRLYVLSFVIQRILNSLCMQSSWGI